jgi:hypothetical protein
MYAPLTCSTTTAVMFSQRRRTPAHMAAHMGRVAALECLARLNADLATPDTVNPRA